MTSSRKTVYSSVITLLLTGIAAKADVLTFAGSQYDNTANTVTAGSVTHNNQTTGNFRDVTWWSINNGQPRVGSGDYINQGNSLVLCGISACPGSGPYTALNFTGPSISGGQSYLSIYDTTPQDGTATRNVFDASVPGGIEFSADVLFTTHSSSGGILALYGEGQDGLALLAHNGNGNNTDNARLDLVWQSNGAGMVLQNADMPALSFTSLNWYRIVMDLSVTGDTYTVNGSFYKHTDGSDPNSALGTQLALLTLSGSLSNPGNGLDLKNPGEVGLMAMGNEGINLPDNVGVSITNFSVPVASVPEPGSAVLLATAAIFGGIWIRRNSRKRPF
jgi:hypothetical protein